MDARRGLNAPRQAAYPGNRGIYEARDDGFGAEIRQQVFERDVRAIQETEQLQDTTQDLRQCEQCHQGKRPVEDLPDRPITSGCAHGLTICLFCLAAFIDRILAADKIGQEPLHGCLDCWAANNVRRLEAQIKCPGDSCGLQLTPRDVTAFASEPGFRLYARKLKLGFKECSICNHDIFLSYGFSEWPINDSCSTKCMQAPPCFECLPRSIKSDLDARYFDRILCPGCSAPLRFNEIQEFVAKDVVGINITCLSRYDTFIHEKPWKPTPDSDGVKIRLAVPLDKYTKYKIQS